MCTIEPFGVVLGSTKWGHAAQAAVDDRVAAGEINDCGGVKFSTVCQHGGRVVFGVIWAASNSVDCIKNLGKIRDGPSCADGRESVSAARKETRTTQEENTDVILTLILRKDCRVTNVRDTVEIE